VLHRLDPELKFILQTHASGVGIAALFYQEHQGARRIISYATTRLNGAQGRHHINEQEFFAIVWAVKKYRPNIEEGHFVLRTDNKARLWLNTTKESNAKLTLGVPSARVQFDGGENDLPDLLSRQPDEVTVHAEAEEDQRMLVPKTCRLSTAATNTIEIPTLVDEVKAAQLADTDTMLKEFKTYHMCNMEVLLTGGSTIRKKRKCRVNAHCYKVVLNAERNMCLSSSVFHLLCNPPELQKVQQ
jgi:hypothetical protein